MVEAVKNVVGKVAAVPKNVVVGYFAGLTYPFRGAKFVFLDNPGLVRFWIFPILITLLALVSVFMGVWEYHDAWVEWLWEEPQGDGFWVSVSRFFHGFVEVLVALVGFLVGLVLVALLSSIFAAPFNDALSEEVERRVTGRGGPPSTLKTILRDLVRTVGLEIGKLALYAVIMGPLFVASLLLPGVGQVLYSIFGFLFTAMYWAIDYVDWPASRRNRGIGYRFGMARQHFLPMFGYGTGVWLFLFIPLVNLLFMPAAVAGGTLLFLDLQGPKEEDAQGSNPKPIESPASKVVEELPP